MEYWLVVSLRSFGTPPEPFESRVREGKVIWSTGGGSGLPTGHELRTVEALFDETERLLRSDVDDLNVKFAEELGYPQAILVDRWVDAFDDEWRWIVIVKPVE